VDRIFKQSERNFLNPKTPHCHELCADCVGTEGRHGWPILEVRRNKELVMQQEIVNKTVLKISVPNDCRRNLFEFEFINKKPDDTVVEDGNIIADKQIIIKNFQLHNANFTQIERFTRYYPIWPEDFEHKPRSIQSSTLSFNGVMKFYYTNPPLEYFKKFKNQGYFDQPHIRKEIENNFEKTLTILQLHG